MNEPLLADVLAAMQPAIDECLRRHKEREMLRHYRDNQHELTQAYMNAMVDYAIKAAESRGWLK